MAIQKSILALSLLATGVTAQVASAQVGSKKCLHVLSYADDWIWPVTFEKTIREKMSGVCKVEHFYMDTKRHPSDDHAKKKAQEAKDLIEKTRPDLVFVSDDNATKWLLMPFYKDASLPFVFLGVNWSLEPYKLPYKNTTGIIEVAPIDAMVYEVKKALPNAKTVAFLTIDTETERKEFPHVAGRFKAAGFELKEYWPKTMAEWKKSYAQAQNETDFVYLGNKLGAADWKDQEAGDWALKNQKKLTAGTYEWMIPVSAFVMAKSATEQAEVAVEQAKKILEGKAPSSVPVTTNKLYDAYINNALMAKSNTKLSEGFMRRAKAM